MKVTWLTENLNDYLSEYLIENRCSVSGPNKVIKPWINMTGETAVCKCLCCFKHQWCKNIFYMVLKLYIVFVYTMVQILDNVYNAYDGSSRLVNYKITVRNFFCARDALASRFVQKVKIEFVHISTANISKIVIHRSRLTDFVWHNYS